MFFMFSFKFNSIAVGRRGLIKQTCRMDISVLQRKAAELWCLRVQNGSQIWQVRITSRLLCWNTSYESDVVLVRLTRSALLRLSRDKRSPIYLGIERSMPHIPWRLLYPCSSRIVVSPLSKSTSPSGLAAIPLALGLVY